MGKDQIKEDERREINKDREGVSAETHPRIEDRPRISSEVKISPELNVRSKSRKEQIFLLT